jgi:hypothetical protein
MAGMLYLSDDNLRRVAEYAGDGRNVHNFVLVYSIARLTQVCRKFHEIGWPRRIVNILRGYAESQQYTVVRRLLIKSEGPCDEITLRIQSQFEELWKLLSNPESTVKHVSFENNIMSAATFRRLFETLKKCNTLKGLCLSNCIIDGSESSPFWLMEHEDWLKLVKKLCKLELRGDQLCSIEAEKLARALKQTPLSGLRALDLSKNSIGNRGAEALAKALCESPSLQTLYLSNNGICCDGAEALAKALLCESPSLQTLDLSNNVIGNMGAVALAKALCESRLQTLYLSDNVIGNRGTVALAKALPVSSSINELDLSDNVFGIRGVEALAEALPVSSSMNKLDLSKNHLDSVLLRHSSILSRLRPAGWNLFVGKQIGVEVDEVRICRILD